MQKINKFLMVQQEKNSIKNYHILQEKLSLLKIKKSNKNLSIMFTHGHKNRLKPFLFI